MPDLSAALQRHLPLVVGSVGDHSVLGTRLTPTDCDLLELRLDALGDGPEVRTFAENHGRHLPILITARHPDEGGVHDLSVGVRARLLKSLLPHASLLDLELRSLPELRPLWSEARRRGVKRIASWHDFDAPPSLADLRTALDAMHAAGADLAKFAFRLVEPEDLQVLIAVLRLESPLPLAVMGMGPLAPASRLLAAQLGSVLNYGFLGGRATAPGQWPARLLKEAIAHSVGAAGSVASD